MDQIFSSFEIAILNSLHAKHVLLLFLVLSIGFIIGKIKFGHFSFGSVAGVLIAGLFFGHFGLRISSDAQAIGFAMFIFSVGYQAGPRFFSVLKEDGIRYALMAIVVAGTGFSVAVVGATLLTLPIGTSAGLLSGGLTSSPTLAAATDAVVEGIMLVPSGITKDEVINNIATGYAITYLFGLVGLISVIKLLPRWLKIDLAADAKRLAGEDSSDKSLTNISSRCYRVTRNKITQLSMAELRERYWDQISGVTLKRAGQKIILEDDDGLQLNDHLEIIGPRQFFIDVAPELGEEISPNWEISDVIDTAQIVVLNEKAIGLSLAEIRIQRQFGLMILKMTQLGVEVPRSNNTILGKGDVLTVMGNAGQINALGDCLGHIEREITQTDMVTFSGGIVAGMLISLLSMEIGGVSVGLGTAGGLLVSGLAVGYLRSKRPTFGQFPEAAQWLLMEFGLLVFMAGVGLRAGNNIIDTFQATGPGLILAGLCVTLLPIFIGYWFGRKVLKMEPVLLLGSITGAMTSGASLAVVTNSANSSLPALGYTGTYAFANVLLMVAGSLILFF